MTSSRFLQAAFSIFLCQENALTVSSQSEEAEVVRAFEILMIEHDPLLVLLAAVICAFGAISTMNVSSRAMDSKRPSPWMLLVALCAGCTVWATHFIAMVAYRQDVVTTYDAGLTALSFACGVVIMGLGFLVAIRGAQSSAARLLGGSVVGGGVIALHYVGMAALRIPGGFSLTPALVGASMVLSVLFGAAALWVAFHPDRGHRMAGALLMVVTIVSLHFVAMGAVHAHPVMPGSLLVESGISRSMMTVIVSMAPISVLLIGLLGAVIDQRVSRRLAAEADRFRTLADGAFEGLVVHRGGAIVDANVAARRLFGLLDNEPNQSIAPWLLAALDPSRATAALDTEVVEITIKRRDGTRFPAELCRRRMLLSDGEDGELCAIRDLTARKESEARIAHLALHDPLTELPNRRFFLELASKAVAHSQRTDEGFALLALDLDDFKHVNDTHGHAAGDELIRILTRRIVSTLRDSDVAARFGGDEFAILQTNVTEASPTMALAERLLEALRAPVQLDYGEITISVSIGIAHYPTDGRTVEELLRNADTAMYRAKSDGKATIRFFEPHMDAALVRRRALERGLGRAVSEKRLRVAYQPIVESGSRRPIGFEALVRWHDPEFGEVTPSDFIPVAEGTGLIVPIAEFVLQEACMAAVHWPSHLRVAVNLSAVQFRRKGLVETVRRTLEESGLPGDRLELEVTETLLMDNRQEALRTLNELKELGVHVSMDDFGTGYSALSYLQCFPFDKIKIDRCFVTDLARNPQNASIVRAVAAMGRSLKMRVVAEGVETDHEAEMLKGLDCDEMQGYLIARPMDASDVQAFLEGYSMHEPFAMLRTA
jgi:diguanylate cyclase (GGDEF)-like protein/PAS domain S-box-containing protein